MIKTNKVIFLLIVIIIAYISSSLPLCCNKEFENSNDLLTLLVETKDKTERMKILEKNRQVITGELVEKFIVKTLDVPCKDYKQDDENLAMIMAEQLNDNHLKGLIMYHRAINAHDYAGKEKYYEQAITYFQQADYPLGIAWCYYSMGNFVSENDRKKAIEILEKAIEFFHTLDLKFNEASCFCRIGMYYFELNNEEKALEYFNKALNNYREVNSRFGEIRVYNDMMLCYGFYPRDEKDYTKALYYNDKALEIILQLTDEDTNRRLEDVDIYSKPYLIKRDKVTTLADFYRKKGQIMHNMMMFTDAIQYHKKAFQLLQDKEKEPGNLLLQELICGDLMVCYMVMGNSREVKEYEQKYREIKRKLRDGSPSDNAYFTYLEGCDFLDDNRPEEAIKKFMEALDILKQVKKADKSYIFYYMARAYFDMEKLDEALYYARKACKEGKMRDSAYKLISKIYLTGGKPMEALDNLLKHCPLKPDDSNKLYSLIDFSYYYSEAGENEKALACLEKSLELAKDHNPKWGLWTFYREAGEIFEKLGEPDDACKCYESSIDIIEHIFNKLISEDYKRDFMENKIKVYEKMIHILLRMGKEKEAFDYNERARARAFLDMIANNSIDLYYNADPELIKRLDENERKIWFYSKNSKDEKKLAELKLEYEDMLEEIKVKNPEYASLKSVSPCSLEEIRGLLDKDTAILEYFSGEKDLILWIITQDSMFTKIIPAGSEDLKEKITSYREQIATHMTVEKIRSTEWKNTASELYTILIDDTNKLLEDKKRLIIIPHKSLHYLPFNTLLDSSGKYLMEKYEIIYLPSASTLSYCKKKNTHKKESLIAFEYGNFNRPPYAPLPDSITEVKAIREIYPQNKVFKGKEITIDAIETDSKNKDLIHFAMHGILDSRAPMFSKLILPEEDLEVYKIFNMKLNASLVTLSACSTGLGKLSKGDELIGFSRAFIYAGTPTVCVSLWDVSDKVTSEFMKRFYLHLKENNSKSQALRLAQMDIIDKYPHPFFWAPFVLIGDWN